MAADAIASNVSLDAAGRIAQDVPCIHCGYNLRSLLPGQACPECNQLVSRSVRGDLLRYSDPRWLRRLRNGMIWVLAGCIVWLVGLWMLDYLASVVSLPGVPRTEVRTALLGLLFGIPVVGVWLATSPEPGPAGAYRDSRVRKAARVLAVGGFLLAFTFTLYLRPGTAAKPATLADLRWRHIDNALQFLLGGAGSASFCMSLRLLARRAGAWRLVRWTWWAGMVLALRGLLMAGMSVWFCTHMSQWLARSPDRVVMTLRQAGWIAYLLEPPVILLLAILYGWVFRREARPGRGAVQPAASDASVAT